MKLFTLVADLELSTVGFDGQVDKATNSGKTLAQRLGADAESIKGAFSDAFSFSLGQLMADAVQAGLHELVEFANESITAASDLEQTNQKIGTIFGDMSSAVMAWSNTTKSEFGIGQLAAKTYAAQLAGILSTDTYGFDSAQLYEYSTAMVELAGDLASFHNMDVDTIWTKILSGLRGETEAIEDLGLDMRVASLAAFAGIDEEGFSALSTVEQWMYRYQYIMQNTTLAQGDFARTSDTYANQMALFEQNINDLKATLGTSLLPVLTDLLSLFNSLFAGEENVEDGINAVKGAFTESAVDIETTATKALALIDALAALEESGKDAAASDQWNAILAQLKQTLPEIGALIDTETGKITGGTEALHAYVTQWKQTSMELAQQQVVQGMYDEYAAMVAEIAQLETEQKIADTIQAGVTEKMDQLGLNLFETVTAGAKTRGAYELLNTLTAQDAEDVLMRIAQGGAMPLEQSEFMKAFQAAGGTYDQLEMMANLYAGYMKTYEENDVDNSKAISERQALLANQEQELTILQQMLTALNEQTGVTVNVTTTVDGQEVANIVESHITTEANNKALTSGG